LKYPTTDAQINSAASYHIPEINQKNSH